VLLLLLLLFRTGFSGASPAVPAQVVPLSQPAPPSGYEVPPGMPPENDFSYHAGLTVPAGYVLTLTATLWSNQAPITLSGPNNAIFLISSKADSVHAQATWKLLGNGALGDGAPLEFSLNADGNPEAEAKSFHVVSPQELAVDWIGVPAQLWPPQNARTRFLLVKGQSINRASADSTVATPPASPEEADTNMRLASPAEWVLGIECRLDPVPAVWRQELDRPRVGLGTNWSSVFEKQRGGSEALSSEDSTSQL
jgi:hypothetical protein